MLIRVSVSSVRTSLPASRQSVRPLRLSFYSKLEPKMKKGIIIGCVVLVLAALAWFGGRKFLGSNDADTVSDGAEVLADATVADENAEGTDAENLTATSGEDTPREESEASPDAENTEDAEENTDGEEAAADEINAASEAAAGMFMASDEGLLYSIKTSAGNNLGMVPIVNGSAVVLIDSGGGTTHQGEYVLSEEQNAFRTKLEEQTALAASEGAIGEWAFYRESSMHDFVFPEGVNSIEKFAFSRSGLTSIVIPEGVTSIGYGAFYHCDDLSDVTIPESVTAIEKNAFAHTPWLENWLAGAAAETEDKTAEDDFLIVGDGILIAYRGSETELELPPEVKTVAAGAFAGN